MIDLYVTYAPNTPRRWVKACLASAEGDAVAVHDVGCTPGDFNGTKLRALDHGSSEWFAFAAGDDLLRPGAVDACAAELAGQCRWVRTQERLIDVCGNEVQRPFIRKALTLENVCQHPGACHHLIVTRKEYVQAALPVLTRHDRHFDWIVGAFSFKLGNGRILPFVGYEWRQHGAQWCRKPEASATIHAIQLDLRRALL